MKLVIVLALIAIAAIIGSQQATDWQAILVGVPFGVAAAFVVARQSHGYTLTVLYPDLVIMPPEQRQIEGPQ